MNYNSHHPVHVKRSVVKSLYNRADRIVTEQNNLRMEHKHLREVLRNNGYPDSFVADSVRGNSHECASLEETRTDCRTIVIPYTKGFSEDVRRICKEYNIRVAFRSGSTLRTRLSKVKDKLPIKKNSKVIYHVPCSCGKVYIGETVRRLETRIYEHMEACKRGETSKSALAEHAWAEGHPILWEEISVKDRAKNQIELKVKEGLHIQLHPEGGSINRDMGLDMPGCWRSTLKAVGHAPHHS